MFSLVEVVVKLSRTWLRGRLTVVALAALFQLLVGGMAWAQTGTSALAGDVTDAQKQVLPGSTVTITHLGTGASQVTVTDERGGFRFGNVQPGPYSIQVELGGFKASVVERVDLQVDSVTRQNITLELGGISETVSVVSEVSHLNTTDASVGNVMSREQIRSLPVEAQNVVHLLSLQPGAIFIPTPTRLPWTRATARWRGRAPTSKASRSTASTSTTRSCRPPTPRQFA